MIEKKRQPFFNCWGESVYLKELFLSFLVHSLLYSFGFWHLHKLPSNVCGTVTLSGIEL